MEILVLFDYTIRGKLVWHCRFEFNSMGSAGRLFHCSSLTCPAAEDTGGLSRYFLCVSQKKEQHLQRKSALRKKIKLVKFSSLWEQLLFKSKPYF